MTLTLTELAPPTVLTDTAIEPPGATVKVAPGTVIVAVATRSPVTPAALTWRWPVAVVTSTTVADLQQRLARGAVDRDVEEVPAARVDAVLEREVAVQLLAGDRDVDVGGGHAHVAGGGVGVDVRGQIRREAHARDREGGLARERAGQARRVEREVRRGAGQRGGAAGEDERRAGDVELRARAVLDERDVAGQLLARDVERQAGAGEAHVWAGRQHQRRVDARDADRLVDARRRC